MPKPDSNSNTLDRETNITSADNHIKNNKESKISGFPSRIKNIFSNFNSEDILLFLILFLLIEEGVDDDFLIIGIILLILTE